MEEIQTLNEHDTEVKELFDSLTVELPGEQNLRVINYAAFKLAIEKMMDKAYYMGSKHSYDTVETVLGSFLK